MKRRRKPCAHERIAEVWRLFHSAKVYAGVLVEAGYIVKGRCEDCRHVVFLFQPTSGA